MIRLNASVAAAILIGTMSLSNAAQVIQNEQFDRMAVQDQSDYIVVLIDGAQKVLIQSGGKDLADKVHKLFVTILPGDQDPIGAVEFESNLARSRVADLRNLEKLPLSGIGSRPMPGHALGSEVNAN